MNLIPQKIKSKNYPSLKEYKKLKKDNFFIKMLSLGLILTPLMISGCQNKEISTKKEVNKSSKLSNKKTPVNISNNNTKEDNDKKLPILKKKKRSINKTTFKTITTESLVLGHPNQPVHKEYPKPPIIKGEIK